jgi:hypothetical protein
MPSGLYVIVRGHLHSGVSAAILAYMYSGVQLKAAALQVLAQQGLSVKSDINGQPQVSGMSRGGVGLWTNNSRGSTLNSTYGYSVGTHCLTLV